MLKQPELFPSVNQIPPTGLTTQKEQAQDSLEGLRRKEEGKYYLTIGNGYVIELTPDQVMTVGEFFLEED